MSFLRKTAAHWGALGFAAGGAFVPGIFSAASAPRWWAIAVGLPLVSTLDPRPLGPAALLLAGALAWGAAIIPFSPYPMFSAFELFLLALLCLAAVAGAGAEPEQVDACLAGLAWALAASSVVAVAQLAGWSPIEQKYGRPGGTFFNAEVFALIAAPIAAWAALGRRWVLLAGSASGLLIAGSRVGALAFLAGLLFGWRGSTWVKLFLVVALAIAGAAAIVALGDAKMFTAFNRAVLWGAALYSMIPQGRGLGWWSAAWQGSYEEYVHSDVLQAMVELGFGAAFLFGAVAVSIFSSSKEGAKSDEALGARARRAAFVALCAEACVSFPLHTPAAGFAFFVLAGHLARRRRPVRGDEPAGGARPVEDVRREGALAR